MTPQQPIGTTARSALSSFVTGLLLGALAFSFAWTSGLAANALTFMLIVLGAMFILRYMLPLNRINWSVVIGVALGAVIVAVKPNLTLSSLGTESLALVLGMLWLMR